MFAIPDPEVVAQVLDQALAGGADFAELFVEDTTTSTLQILGGKLDGAVSGHVSGAGLRVFYGDRAYYASLGDPRLDGLLAAAKDLAALGPGTPGPTRTPWPSATPLAAPVLPASATKATKVARLLAADRAARAASPTITQVEFVLTESHQRVFIANSEGTWVSDDRPYIRVAIKAIASRGDEKQTAKEGPSAMAGWGFIADLDLEAVAARTARSAATMLDAAFAPAGKMPVLLASGSGAVIFHEACGHLLETTAVEVGDSVFADQMGQAIAHPCVTAWDDGTLLGEWGSLAIDDEGMPTERTVLIQDGVLASFIVDKLGARKTGHARTGSGRRESYHFAPASRMRNTGIAPGQSTFAEMLGSIPYGLYAVKVNGGEVQPGTGEFNFMVAEGYMIRDGRLAEPVRGATLVGSAAEVLQNIVMVGDDFAMAPGFCGSVSGTIPCNVGQPAIKVASMVVGGRA